jgi:hypothetical protein
MSGDLVFDPPVPGQPAGRAPLRVEGRSCG